MSGNPWVITVTGRISEGADWAFMSVFEVEAPNLPDALRKASELPPEVYMPSAAHAVHTRANGCTDWPRPCTHDPAHTVTRPLDPKEV